MATGQNEATERSRVASIACRSTPPADHGLRTDYDAAPAVILAAAAARTSQIRLRSAVTVLSAADPVRVFQEFATVDLISGGRVELVVGRGSFTEAFPLFGLDLADYDELFDEKLDLLLRLRESTEVTWSGVTGRLSCDSASTRAPCKIHCPSG